MSHRRTGLRLPAALLAAAIFAGGCPPPAALAQEAGKSDAAKSPGPSKVTTTTVTYDNWTVVCSRTADQKSPSCSASFRGINSQNQAVLVVWLFGRNAKGEKMAEFRTLTDVLIEPGLTITLPEGEPLKARFVSCGTSGCQAAMALDDDTIERLRPISSATLSMVRTDNQLIQFKLDLKGITQALKDLGF